MFKKLNIRATIISGLIAAILFCIPAFIYIRSAYYEQSWLLYIGSFLFMAVMWVHTIRDSQKRDNNESTVALVFASHMATIVGIIFSCIICFLMLSLFLPGYFDKGPSDKVLADAPANVIHDKTGGLSFNVFMAATIINFSVGSFTGIILPFYLKKNQTKDRRVPTPLHNRGTK
jgi:hypothetical protein